MIVVLFSVNQRFCWHIYGFTHPELPSHFSEVDSFAIWAPVMKALHWLPVRYRIDFKIIIITYKALNELAPYRIYATSITQQRHWVPQDQLYCWYRGVRLTRLVAGYSTIQYPHHGISSQTNWDIVIQSIVLNLSLKWPFQYYIFLNSVMSMYILTVIFYLVYPLLCKTPQNNTIECGVI